MCVCIDSVRLQSGDVSILMATELKSVKAELDNYIYSN